VHKIFEEAQERFGAINGGYTRIVKIGRRPGDAAPLTIVELCSSDVAAPTKKKKAKKRSQAKPVAAPEPKKTPAAARRGTRRRGHATAGTGSGCT
jgi:large subunit ribosomal protein L17